MVNKNRINDYVTEILYDLSSFAISHCGSELSEDMIQATVEYVLKNKQRLNEHINDKNHLLVYCKTKLKNLTKDHFRKFNKIDQFKDVEDKPYGFEIDEITFLKGDLKGVDPLAKEDLNRAMAKVSPECRELLILTEFEEKTPEETATKLGIPVSTVGTRKHRCIKKMFKIMSPSEEEKNERKE